MQTTGHCQVLGTDGYDRLGKVRGIVDVIKSCFLAVYDPRKESSIGEGMIPIKVRSYMKQNMPKKPVKRGFKIWMRADALNGYVTELSVFTGKTAGAPEKNIIMDLNRKPTKQRIPCVHR